MSHVSKPGEPVAPNIMQLSFFFFSVRAAIYLARLTAVHRTSWAFKLPILGGSVTLFLWQPSFSAMPRYKLGIDVVKWPVSQWPISGRQTLPSQKRWARSTFAQASKTSCDLGMSLRLDTSVLTQLHAFEVLCFCSANCLLELCRYFEPPVV